MGQQCAYLNIKIETNVNERESTWAENKKIYSNISIIITIRSFQLEAIENRIFMQMSSFPHNQYNGYPLTLIDNQFEWMEEF